MSAAGGERLRRPNPEIRAGRGPGGVPIARRRGSCPILRRRVRSVSARSSGPVHLRRSEIPIIVTLHDVTRDTAALRRAGKAFFRTLCTLAEVVIVHTDTAAELVSAGIGCAQQKIFVVQHLEPTLPPSGKSAEEILVRHQLGGRTILLAFGFIHVDKGLDDLVRALGILAQHDPPVLEGVHLVVAGAVRRRGGLSLPSTGMTASQARPRHHFRRRPHRDGHLHRIRSRR